MHINLKYYIATVRSYILMVALLFAFDSVMSENLKVQSDVKLAIESNKEADSLVFIFSGDIMGHSPQYQAAYNPVAKSYNYNVCFKEVRPYISNADFAITNLEVPIAGKPYSGYPNFSSPDALLDGLKYAGYDVLLTANNHVLDRGKTGLEQTIHKITDRNLRHLGSYVDANQRDSMYPLVLKSKGVKIAVFNYTYGTNAGIVTSPNIVNYIDTFKILNDIRLANEDSVDFKIMTIHWGDEYELYANEYQRNLARFFVDQGINLIIGSHPHVVQNFELLYNKDSIAVPVFYSLGNSISNQRKLHTNGGIMARVVIDTQRKCITNTSYIPVYVHKGVLKKVYQYHLIPTNKYFSHPENYRIPLQDKQSLLQFDIETRKRLSDVACFGD